MWFTFSIDFDDDESRMTYSTSDYFSFLHTVQALDNIFSSNVSKKPVKVDMDLLKQCERSASNA